MRRVLGIGTLWALKRLLKAANGSNPTSPWRRPFGDGPKGERLRFDLERVSESLATRAHTRSKPPRMRRGRPRKTRLPSGVELIQPRVRA
jgi:hypothetical protein